MRRSPTLLLGALCLALAAGAATSDPRQVEPGGDGPRADRGSPRAAYGYERPERSYRPGPPAYGGYPAPDYRGPYPAPRQNSLGADWREQQEEARSGVRMGQMAPLGQVIQGIGRRSAGRPLDAGIEYFNGRAAYRVRWMTTHGRRVDYIVDAATGAILAEH